MKRIILPVLALLAAATLFTSCEKVKGKGDVVTQQRAVGTFNSVNLSMEATVYYTEGTEYSLKISGQQNVLDEVITQVEGTRLVVRVRNNVILGKHEPVRVEITAPALSGMEVSGSGTIYTDRNFSPSALSLNISGSGEINLASIAAGTLTANISGSGNIKVSSGTAQREELTISGSGTIDLRSVACDTVYTRTSGSGDTYVNAKNLLDVTISGSGGVWYYGQPVINTHISGSGNVNRM